MSLMTRAAIIDKYGLRLTMEQLADVLGLNRGSVYNLAASGELPVPTYKEGTRRFASYDAVADYLDAMAEVARTKKEEQA